MQRYPRLMSETPAIKPTDKNIAEYLEALSTFLANNVSHEGATETAFSRLLGVTAKKRNWMLIPKQMMPVGKAKIYPDGTLRDGNFLRRGCGQHEYHQRKRSVGQVATERIRNRVVMQ